MQKRVQPLFVGDGPRGGPDGMTFDVVFGVFAAAMLVIAVLIVRWALREGRRAKRLFDAERRVGPDGDR